MEKPGAYEKLGLREKIGYGMGDAGSGMIWSVLALYLTWFYTDVYGLNAGVVGTLFLVIRIFDAFSDPLMGAICDRPSRAGVNSAHGYYGWRFRLAWARY
jgi:Na+/melibiose symporter-like transporter